MRKLKNLAAYAVLTVVSFLSVFPLYWMIAAATNNSTDILGGRLIFGVNLFNNLEKLLEQQNVGRAFGNSPFYSTVLSLLS